MTLMVAILMLALAALPNLTPPAGALNRQVTQTNIGRTICIPGWTKTERPYQSAPVGHVGRPLDRSRCLLDPSR
jgi:hypothetical protein